MASLPLVLLVGGFFYWLGLQGKVSTDNAYVEQDMVAVGAEVGGRIVEVRVEEGQRVRAGQLLFRIDPEPYQLEIARADAASADAIALDEKSPRPLIAGLSTHVTVFTGD